MHGSHPGVRAVMIGMFRSQHYCRGYMLHALGGNSTAKDCKTETRGTSIGVDLEGAHT